MGPLCVKRLISMFLLYLRYLLTSDVISAMVWIHGTWNPWLFFGGYPPVVHSKWTYSISFNILKSYIAIIHVIGSLPTSPKWKFPAQHKKWAFLSQPRFFSKGRPSRRASVKGGYPQSSSILSKDCIQLAWGLGVSPMTLETHKLDIPIWWKIYRFFHNINHPAVGSLLLTWWRLGNCNWHLSRCTRCYRYCPGFALLVLYHIYIYIYIHIIIWYYMYVM